MPAPSSLGRVLVVDDEPESRNAVAALLRDEGYEVETAADGFKALGKYDAVAPHVVISDLRMPGMTGLELLAKIREKDAPASVIVCTAFAEVRTAVAAMRSGAADYLTKPCDADELVLVVGRVREHQQLLAQTRQMRARLGDRFGSHSIVGRSAPMARVFDAVRQVAPSRATVLITGESGTGKELVASAIHEGSPRAGGPFIKVHCAALAESVLESELFGHEKGAFTGAVARRDGRFSLAHEGTLFLDEIGEISPAIQVKLLRFLQEREFERVGGDRPIQVDVRVIAATNRDLPAMVRDGRFREDLYYRLNVVGIEMPPLRDRRDDIPALAQHFLDRFVADNGKPLAGIAADALAALCAWDWPGNVRELENAVERAVVMTAGPRVTLRDLPPSVGGIAARPDADGVSIPGASMYEIERHAILKTLEATRGSTSKAAEVLGISVRSIQYKLQEYRPAAKSGVGAVKKD
jgi:two-component system NtrC family response regulator/two-component system response regulator HydG